MDSMLGTLRAGKIELDGPPPADWVEGTKVTITLAEQRLMPGSATPDARSGKDHPTTADHGSATDDPSGTVDLLSASPAAIAAWLQWYQAFRALPRTAGSAEELEAFLQQRRTEELAKWNERCQQIEASLP